MPVQGPALDQVRPAGDERSVADRHRQLAQSVIVIGSHGPKAFDRVFVGSTAARLVREAPCPVLTVRPGGIKDVSPAAPSEQSWRGSWPA